MATIVANASGGTRAWSDTNTWVGGAIPDATSDVQLTNTSGSVTIDTGALCRSLDCTGYTGILTHNAAATLTIGDPTAGASNIALKLVAGMTYTLNDPATAAIAFVSTSATVQTVDFASLTSGNVTYNTTSNGSWQLVGTHNTGATATITLTQGTLDVNGQTCSWGLFNSNNSNVRSLSLGAANITMTGAGGSFQPWTTRTSTSLTLNAGTSTITLTGGTSNFEPGNLTYYNLVMQGSGTAVIFTTTLILNNLTRTGTASKTDALSLVGSTTINGTFTFNGNSATNRLSIQSSVTGTARTITAAALPTTNAYVDFTDITGAGAADWNLTHQTTDSFGNCGGNSGITFTTSAAQTWSGTSGGNWSTNAWTTRVPLPQDDVVINAAFSASQTVTADMPRLGRSIDWTGATGSPIWSFGSTGNTIYGSVTLIAGMSLTGTNPTTLAGRGSFTITSAGVQYGRTINIGAPTGTYTLQDSFSSTGASGIQLNNGTFSANGFNVTLPIFASASSATRTLTMGSGTWTLTSTGAATIWNINTTGMTLNGNSSTILISQTSTNTRTFTGGGFTYGTLTYTVAGSTGTLLIQGANTFGTINFSDASNARTLQFTSSTTTTIINAFNVRGTSGKLMTVNASTGGTAATLTRAFGVTSVDFLSIQDSTANGNGVWYAGANSTSVSGNTGWNFSTPAGKYWVGGTATWDATVGTKWATSSGGAGGAAIPTVSDDVFFDANSGANTITLSGSSVCRSLNCNGFTGTISHPSSTTFNIGDNSGATAGLGNSALSLAGSYSIGSATTSTIAFVSTSSTVQGVDFAAISVPSVNFNATSGGSWQLIGQLNNSATAAVSLTKGTLNTNGQTCSWGIFNSNNNNTRSLTLGASSITITGTGFAWNFSGSSSGLTLSAASSTITCTGSAATFNTGGTIAKTYGTVIMNGSGAMTFTGGTLGTLTRTATAVKTDSFIISGATTVTSALNFTGGTGGAANRLLVQSSTVGTATSITNSGATMNWQYVDLMDISLGTAFNASAITGNSGDCGGNTNITFTSAAAQTWSGTSGGNWSTNAWTSRLPLPQDSVVISSAFAASQTITADMPRLGGSIDWTGATGSPTWSFSSLANTIFGSTTLISGMTISGTQTLTFGGRSTYTITSASKTWTMALNFTAPSGTYTLQDAMTSNNGICSLNNGTFNANNQSVTFNNFSSSNSNTRTLSLGSGTWSITGSGGGAWNVSSTGLTLNISTSTIALTNNSSSSKTFVGGGLTYNNLSISSGGTGAVIIQGSNTFNVFTINAPKTVTFTSTTTQTVSSFVALGFASNLITINASTPTSAATLSKASGTVSCDYLSLTDSAATGGAGWYAGNNSSSVSGNSGWILTTPPGLPYSTQFMMGV